MLGDLLRGIFRLVMLPVAEWRKARVDLAAAASLHQVRAGTAAEVAKLRVSLANLERLHEEAAAALARHPAASALIVELLRQQERELRRAAACTVIEDLDEAAD